LKLRAVLALKDGTIIRGAGFGAPSISVGEVVFNTSMTGYQEALTDPSYNGQILTWTYPLCGNYGINKSDFESDGIKVEAFLVHEPCTSPEHWQMRETLDSFLKSQGIPGMSGFDTRSLTKKIRVHGVLEGTLCVYGKKQPPVSSLVKMAKDYEYGDQDLVLEVSAKKPKIYGKGRTHVIVLDCGVKMNIIRCLNARGAKVTVVPADYGYDRLAALKPDGVLVSNGPGDPEKAEYAIKATRRLLDDQVPLMGICLGHQILGLATGSKTYKLKFGHRGANHPVKDLDTGRTYITSQNHGYAISADDISSELEITHLNLNDSSIEGVRHRELPAFSVQWHPEGSPGPRDTQFLFDHFLETIKNA